MLGCEAAARSRRAAAAMREESLLPQDSVERRFRGDVRALVGRRGTICLGDRSRYSGDVASSTTRSRSAAESLFLGTVADRDARRRRRRPRHRSSVLAVESGLQRRGGSPRSGLHGLFDERRMLTLSSRPCRRPLLPPRGRSIYSIAQCNCMSLHVRVQRRNRTTLAWEDVDHRHGNSSIAEDYDPLLCAERSVGARRRASPARLPYYVAAPRAPREVLAEPRPSRRPERVDSSWGLDPARRDRLGRLQHRRSREGGLSPGAPKPRRRRLRIEARSSHELARRRAPRFTPRSRAAHRRAARFPALSARGNPPRPLTEADRYHVEHGPKERLAPRDHLEDSILPRWRSTRTSPSRRASS